MNPRPAIFQEARPASGLGGGVCAVGTRWFAVALTLGLLATLAGWLSLRENESRLESAYHEAAADRLLQQVNERFGKVDLILRGVAGLFSAQNLVERREFEDYVAGLRPIDALPEVVGIGFLRRVETARVDAIETLLSAAYEREVRIVPVPDPTRHGQRSSFPSITSGPSRREPSGPSVTMVMATPSGGRPWTRPCAPTGWQ